METNLRYQRPCSSGNTRILPTRNGNPIGFRLPRIGGGLRTRILPTRNGNGFAAKMTASFADTDPTYKEWKPASAISACCGVGTHGSYLQGMETAIDGEGLFNTPPKGTRILPTRNGNQFFLVVHGAARTATRILPTRNGNFRRTKIAYLEQFTRILPTRNGNCGCLLVQ